MPQKRTDKILKCEIGRGAQLCLDTQPTVCHRIWWHGCAWWHRVPMPPLWNCSTAVLLLFPLVLHPLMLGDSLDLYSSFNTPQHLSFDETLKISPES